MNRYLYYDPNPVPVAAGTTPRGPNRPHAGTVSQSMMVWTDDDLEKLHIPGLISIVERIDDEGPNQIEAADGVNFDEGDVAVVSEIGIEILEGYVSDVQTELCALEGLTRRHDVSLALCAATDVPKRN